MDILGAAEKAAEGDLLNSLKVAAEEGLTSTVETLLGIYVGPREASAEKVQLAVKEALAAASGASRWGTVVYLASFLEDSRGGAQIPTQYPPSPLVMSCLLGNPSGGILGFYVPKATTEDLPPLDIIGMAESEGSPLPDIAGSMMPKSSGSGVKYRDSDIGPDPDQTEILFEHINPEVAEGDFGSKDDPAPYFHLTAKGMEKSLGMLQDPDQVVIRGKQIVVRFDYPLGDEHDLKLEPPSGAEVFTRAGLAEAIAKKYQQIYREEEETTGLPIKTVSGRRRREGFPPMADTDGKWGIWGHILGDLDLHSVRFDAAEGVYRLGIDS